MDTESVAGGLKTALCWVNKNLNKFSIRYWSDDPDRNLFPHGPLVELCMALETLNTDTIQRNLDVSALLELGDEVVAFESGRVEQMPIASRTFWILCVHALADLHGRLRGKQLVPPAYASGSEEEILMQLEAVLDRAYITDRLGYGNPGADYAAALDHYLRRRGRSQLGIADAYTLTHFVLYNTHFGAQPPAISAKHVEVLVGDLLEFAKAARTSSNLDLAAEIEAARICMADESSQFRASDQLVEQVQAAGFLPGPGFRADGSYDPDHVYKTSYHSTIAFIVMAGLTLTATKVGGGPSR